MTVAAGSRLGPYEILSPLGAGGMGEVYRAKDERLSREVAIKVLPAAVASDAERLKRFEKEARAASALNHPNIVTIYDIGSTEGVSWIAMEKVEGTTLRELLASGALAVKRLLQIAPQIAEGLAKAHESGIVHRDLKPENVMVTKNGLVKVLDFGLAKLTSTMSGSGEGSALPTMTGTTPGVVVGTVGYMSPEQASGESLDFRSDQFSFGSMLYEMATGKRAFQKKTAIDTLGAILNEDPPPIASVNPSIPAPLRWVVERCLSKEPEGRYGATGDLARDLAMVRDHLSEASGTSEVVAPGRKRPRLVAIALSAGALAVGLVVGRLLLRTPPPSFPRFQQLTFGDATVMSARFSLDGQTVVYGITRDFGPFELLSTRVDAPESRPLGLNADIESISSSGEMAILLGGPGLPATLAEVPLAGGAPRELLERVMFADWSPDGTGLAVVVGAPSGARLEFPIGKTLIEKKGFLGRPRFSAQGDGILIADPDSLLLVDPKTGKNKEVFQGGTEGYGWSTISDQIWFMSGEGATTEIRALKVGGPARLIATLPGKFLMHDIGKDGRILAERILGRTQMMGKAPDETRDRDLSWLNQSFPADISPDGRTILFTEGGGGARAGVYLRRTDGSPAIRLGDGDAGALSPDGKWALCRRGDETILQPTGAGQSRVIKAPGIEFEGGGAFYPDGKRLLLTGRAAKERPRRLFSVTLEGGDAHPVTPEGVFLPFGWHAFSPDRTAVAAMGPNGIWSIYPVEEGASVARPMSGSKEEVICWSADGRSLLVRAMANGSLLRVDLASGQRELVKEFPGSSALWVTPDGRGYVYERGENLSNLWLIDGLKP